MSLEDELRLSYYREVSPINAEHGVFLVWNDPDKRAYVKKTLEVYNPEVFSYLKMHPVKNMPRIIEAVEDKGKLITIEEYISGMTLEECMEKYGLPGEGGARKIMGALCETLKELHGAQPPIIHRDIKPSNIMMADDGRVMLLDLDAAKPVNRSINKDTILIGTEGYAAPEQYGFSSSSERTDIYAAGVVLNIMLTGKLPGETLAEGELGKIVRQCTKMEPEDRYESADEILKALKKKDSLKGIKSFALPGFRGMHLAVKLLTALGYILLFALIFTMKPEGLSGAALWVNRIMFAAGAMAIILLLGNYRNIQEKLGLKKIRNVFLRALALAALSFVILFAAATITVIAESLIK